jgi:DNA-binding IclR family transcriptional regulator
MERFYFRLTSSLFWSSFSLANTELNFLGNILEVRENSFRKVRMLKRNGMYIRRIVLHEEGEAPGSIPRAAKIIACLSRKINTVSDIAAESKLPKSTVHRVLKLMEASYMVSEDLVDRRYYLGPLITQLSISPLRLHEYMIRCTDKEMRRLSNLSEETITLDILSGVQPVHLFEITGKQDFRVRDISFRNGTLFAGASGKMLLSQMSEAWLEAHLKNIFILPLTSQTVTDGEVLLSQIRDMRKVGYAVSAGERISGALCISVPVMNYTSPISLSIVGPESRLKPKLDYLIEELKASGIRASRNVLDIYAIKR